MEYLVGEFNEYSGISFVKDGSKFVILSKTPKEEYNVAKLRQDGEPTLANIAGTFVVPAKRLHSIISDPRNLRLKG